MSNIADEFDFGADGEAQASPDALARLRSSLQEMFDVEAAIENMEGDLKAAKKMLQLLRTGRIPDLMGEIQSDHFTHAGFEVKLSDFVSGSLPKEGQKRTAALEYLEKHDGSSLIKTGVSLDFGKSQHNEALDLANRLMEEGHTVSVQSGVNAQTLQKYARDRIRDGDPIDAEVLGLFVGKIAKAKPVKVKS